MFLMTPACFLIFMNQNDFSFFYLFPSIYILKRSSHKELVVNLSNVYVSSTDHHQSLVLIMLGSTTRTFVLCSDLSWAKFSDVIVKQMNLPPPTNSSSFSNAVVINWYGIKMNATSCVWTSRKVGLWQFYVTYPDL